MDTLVISPQRTFSVYGPKVLIALALLIVGWILAGWVGAITRRALQKARVDETLTKFLGRSARWSVLVLVFVASLSLFGVETTSLAAVIGSAGIAIGLAFQGTLSNFAAGAMLLMFRPFDVSDVIRAAGELGKVDCIDLFTTTIDTFDNRRIIVPNSQLFGSTIVNVTHHPHRRTEVTVGVDYSADIDQTRDVLQAAAERVADALADPAPDVVLQDLGDSAVIWSVRAWAVNDNFGSVRQAMIREVKNALDAAGIGIPYPQMDVHLPTGSNREIG